MRVSTGVGVLGHRAGPWAGLPLGVPTAVGSQGLSVPFSDGSFTQNKGHPVKVHSSVVFSGFIKLNDDAHLLIPEPVISHCPPQPLATTSPLSVP